MADTSAGAAHGGDASLTESGRTLQAVCADMEIEATRAVARESKTFGQSLAKRETRVPKA